MMNDKTIISQNPYTEEIIEKYQSYEQYKTIQLINSAQEAFINWKNLKIKNKTEYHFQTNSCLKH